MLTALPLETLHTSTWWAAGNTVWVLWLRCNIDINEEKIVPEREIKVFYSWQSDLPNSTTRGLIQSSIEAAVRNMRDTVEVTADRDTQGVYGSPRHCRDYFF